MTGTQEGVDEKRLIAHECSDAGAPEAPGIVAAVVMEGIEPGCDEKGGGNPW